ncbi:immunomodulatory protein [Mycena rebaudengoi]|nr:immunomodulatory protein [Mycena rebaudengoi]
MKFSTAFTAPLLLLAFGASSALAVTLAYDEHYDVASNSLDIVACSDGTHGLETLGYTTFGSLPNFPFIGAASAIAGWNSPQCGTCWKLTYTNSAGVAKSINVLAVDHAGAGFNIGLKAMNTLTNNQAVKLGRVDVQSVQVAKSVCGL